MRTFSGIFAAAAVLAAGASSIHFDIEPQPRVIRYSRPSSPTDFRVRAAVEPSAGDLARIQRAADKRARKAAKRARL